MRMIRFCGAIAIALMVAACSTGYGSSGITGGHSAKELEPGIWRVVFLGNGFTTPETTQTYWLYRCAELTLEKGADGFEIMSRIQLTEEPGGGAEPLIELAKGGPVYIPMYMGPSSPKPSLEADIRLLKKPFETVPAKIFDATKLKEALEPYVTGQKCDMGNVCPHVHRYLYPN